MHKVNPITYLQELALKWAHTAAQTGSNAVILGGDLNSRWLPAERGGQRSIEEWCDTNFLINGPRQIADALKTTFITRGHETENGTWIDHILHLGHSDNIQVLGALNSQNSEWQGVTDHRPLWVHYATAQPSTCLLYTSPSPRD